LILGTASGAQNLGVLGALGVGSYVILAGLLGRPISGAFMNPHAPSAPSWSGSDFTSYWVYIVGPLVGAAIAVAFAYVLRGPGGGTAGSAAAQGDLFTEVHHPQPTPSLRRPVRRGPPRCCRSRRSFRLGTAAVGGFAW
jgi:aquaporin Z